MALVGSKDGRAAEWLPARVQQAVIALDGDEKGKEAAEVLRQSLPEKGISGVICTPPDDGLDKDWSERWRRGQHAAVWSVFEAMDQVAADAAQPSTFLL